jgi:cytochrome c peroxidase
MAFTHDLTIDVLLSIPQYVDAFKGVYGNPNVSIDEVKDAIAAFEATLVTPDSRFDQYLKGKKHAITPIELSGYELFKSSGCVACHYGPAVGGASFQKMGLFGTYETKSGAIGRADVTGQDADRMKFKVPTLRNVELTYPYFHDGAARTLEDAVTTMGKLQLGREFTIGEVAEIVAFLRTLTGTQPSFLLPILPPSTSITPQPKPFSD